MDSQIAELHFLPDPDKFNRIRNPPDYCGEHLAWLTTHYCGNKPGGGLWTSSATPDSFISDWHRGRRTNPAIRHAYPDALQKGLKAYRLEPKNDARILVIGSLDDASRFTQEFHRSYAPEMLLSISRLTTREITNWQRAFRGYDGIQLTAEAANEIAYAAFDDGVDTAFHTWNCESTLWGRWVFTSVVLA